MVLNVGIGAGGAWLEGTSAESWDKVFAINLRSHMLTVKHAMPKLADGIVHRFHFFHRGHDGRQPVARLRFHPRQHCSACAVTSRSKARGAAIRANVDRAGIDGHIHRHGSPRAGVPIAQRRNVPLSRQGTGWETAYAALFLMSDESAYITAQTLAVDGGLAGYEHDFPKARYEAGVSDFGNGSFCLSATGWRMGLSNSGLVTERRRGAPDRHHVRLRAHPRDAGRFRARDDAKIGTLFNTHHNGDHCYGNALVEGAEIIATERAADAMGHETPERLAD